jgi:hypothetical protein
VTSTVTTGDELAGVKTGGRCRLVIQLDGGETLHARAGTDREAAVAALASLQGRLGTESYVLLGDDVVVRGAEVRYIRVHEDGDDASGPGLIDSIKSKLGGSDMSTTSYETDRETRAQRRTDGEGQGFADQWVGYGRRPWAETKPFFMTSEFLTLIAGVIGVLVATAMVDEMEARWGWLLVTVLGAAYMVSRGIAKAGTRDPNPRDGSRY